MSDWPCTYIGCDEEFDNAVSYAHHLAYHINSGDVPLETEPSISDLSDMTEKGMTPPDLSEVSFEPDDEWKAIYELLKPEDSFMTDECNFDDFTDNQEDDMSIVDQLEDMEVVEEREIRGVHVMRFEEWFNGTWKNKWLAVVSEDEYKVGNSSKVIASYIKNHTVSEEPDEETEFDERIEQLEKEVDKIKEIRSKYRQGEVIENPSPEDLEPTEWYWAEDVTMAIPVAYQWDDEAHGFINGPDNLRDIRRVQKIPRPDWD
jgi:hypothetical protein